jgi:autotransporter-associated beta strand protein
MCRRRYPFIAFTSIALLSATASVHAQVAGTWVGPSTGSWSVGANWSSDPLYPSGTGSNSFLNGGTAIFNSGPVDVVFDTNVTLGLIRFNTTSQINISSLNFRSLTFSAPALIEVPLYKQSAPGTNYYTGHTLSPIIYGNADLHVTGPGAVVLTASNNYYFNTTIDTGAVVGVGSYSSLGTSGTVYFNSGTVRGIDPINITSMAKNIDVQAGGGTIASLYTGLNWGGQLTGSGPLTIAGPATVSMGFGGTYSGAVRVVGGTPAALTGKLDFAQSFTLGGNLSMPFGTAGNNLLSDGTLALRGGTLTRTDAYGGAGSRNEHIGTLLLDGGNSTIMQIPRQNNPLSLTAIALSRADRGTLRVGGDILGDTSGPFQTHVYFDQPASVPLVGGGGSTGSWNISIVPFIVPDPTSVFGPSFLTYDNVAGLRPLSATGEYALSIAAATLATANVNSGSDNVPSAKTINSLLMPSAYSTVYGPGTLTVTSGAVFGGGVDAPLDFGSAEGVISSSTISGPISGTNGITLNGPVTLSSTASTYTGTTTLNSGTLTIWGAPVTAGVPGPLGADTSPLVLMGRGSGATLYIASEVSVSRDLLVRSDADLLNGFEPVLRGLATWSGNVTIEGPLRLEQAMTLTGQISGPGRLIIGPTSIATLSGNNSFAGGVDLSVGTAVIGSSTALGTGTIFVGNGVNGGAPGHIVTAGPPVTRTLPNPIVFTTDDLGFYGSGSVILSGSIDLNGETHRIFTQSNTSVTVTGGIFGGGLIWRGSGTINGGVSCTSLTKEGSGTLSMPNVRVPAVAVDAGTLQILAGGGDSGTSRVRSLSIDAKAHMNLRNNGLVIDYDAVSPAAAVGAMLADGRLFSSNSDAIHALGYGENSILGYAVFLGQNVDPSTVLIRYTYAGDANLDGAVDIRDLYALATHYNTSGDVWTSGDFNYDGVTNVKDLTALAINWQAGVNAPLSLSFGAALANVNLGVPEPGNLAFLFLASAIVHRRRR